MSKKKRLIEPFQKIKFLNLPEKTSMSSIGVKIQGNILGEETYKDNYEIKISDCNNHIILHGSLKNPKSRENCLNKLNILIEVLTDAKNHIKNELKKNKLK